MPTSSKNTEIPSEIKKFSKPILGVAAVLLALGIAVTVFSGQKAERTKKAENALFEARQKLDKNLTAIAAAQPAPAATGTSESSAAKSKTPPAPPASMKPAQAESVAYLKLDVDTQLIEGAGELRNVAQQYGGTRAAHEANLMLGDLYYNHGDAAKSITWYQAAVDTATDGSDRALSLYDLAYAYENSGKFPEAVKTYEKGMNQGEPALQGEIMLGLARSQEKAGDKAKAKETYTKISTQFPNTEVSKSADIRKTRLEQAQ
ncbi:MAG: tetratricopeptide repeat protein [Methylotenera sp.]|nr:tetratricopeptide repeat protein [Oligoflexia bacterium]